MAKSRGIKISIQREYLDETTAMSPNWAIANLAQGMLRRAILDLDDATVTVETSDRRSALAWFTCPDIGGISFRWVCEVLQLDLKKTLEKIARISPAVGGVLVNGQSTRDDLCSSNLSHP